MTNIYQANSDNITKASKLIQNGDLVAFPTETVYGLGANVYDSKAISKIYEAKSRPSFNPLISHLSCFDEIKDYAKTDARVEFLANKFCPGPITFVLPRIETKPSLDLICAGLRSITVRIPNHKTALELIAKSGVPIAAPSANRSMSISPTSAQAVHQSLGDRVSMILDGGACSVGLESTIIDLTTTEVVLLRAGGITKEMLEEALQEKVIISGGNADKPSSPGQMLKHYAPNKPFRINATSKDSAEELFIGFGDKYSFCDMNLSPTGDLFEAAANLFSYMSIADNNPEFNKIAMCPIELSGIGMAINDRIKRASYK